MKTWMAPKEYKMTGRMVRANQLVFVRDNSLCREGYEIKIVEGQITIKASSQVGFDYAKNCLFRLKNHPYDTIYPEGVIKDWPSFSRRGILIDITRGRVPTLESLKRLVDELYKMNVNELQVYMEHTMDLTCLKPVTKSKSPITKEEFRDLDVYCQNKHIELIPCIATYGHLYEVLRTEAFSHLMELEEADTRPFSYMDRQIGHTINGEDSRSLAFIDAIIEEIAPLYTSKYLNICGDETYDIGKGKNKALAEDLGVEGLYIRFLNKIMDRVKAHGKIPMYWADVIMNHPDRFEELNEGGLPMYWWYDTTMQEGAFETMAKLGRPYYACPAVVGWNRLINDYDRAYQNLNQMTLLAQSHHAKGMLITDWGDFGHINVPSTSLPYQLYGAHLMWSGNPIPMEELHRNLGEALYGHGDFFMLVYEAGRCQKMTWEDLIKWYYEVRDHNTAYGSILAYLNQLDEEGLLEVLKSLSSYQMEMARLEIQTGQISMNYGLDRREMSLMVEGVRLILELFVVLINKAKNKPVDFMKNENLKLDLDQFLKRYQEVWLIRNKPSELDRLIETFQDMVRRIFE